MQESLPIMDIMEQLKKSLLSTNTVILQAPPGAGKSTVLPLQLLEESWLSGKKMIMLEPRRLAARAVAHRMSSLLGTPVGDTVGYRVRFENKVSDHTKIEVLTEGILTRMLQKDNSLEGVGLVIFDEFHERSLHADLALALCREIQQVLREDLKILVMSATLDSEKIAQALGNPPILTSQGRQHPIEHIYFPQDSTTPIPVQVTKGITKAFHSCEGDILAFLPGAGEILRTTELLATSAISAQIYPLYGDLTQEKQQEAILPDPYGRRKIVLATSIAETSLTIEGIKIVVDSGYSRVPRFDPRSGLTKLETVRVSKDSADQRAGRAGRLGPGVCYRLWSEGTHQHLSPQRTPEIAEADLAPTLLEVAQWGVQDIHAMNWITPPPSGAVNQAKDLLHKLEALQENKITERGKAMLHLPTHPRLAHMLLKGKDINKLSLAIDIASLLEERDPLPKGSGADLTIRIESLRKWRKKEYVNADRNLLERIERVAYHWRKILRTDADNAHIRAEEAGLMIAFAYPERIAKQQEHEIQRYRLANSRVVKLLDNDPLIREKYLAVAHLDSGTNEGRIFLAAPLDPEELDYLIEEKKNIGWDAAKGTIIARLEKRIGDIVLETTPLEKISEEERVTILSNAIKSEGLQVLNWTESEDEWLVRMMNLKKWRPEEEWPDLSKEKLAATAENWLGPYLGSVRKKDDFKKLDLLGILNAMIPWDLNQRMEQLAPAKIKVPSGSLIKLSYQEDGSAPVLAVRLQEVFGLLESPVINEGRTKVLMHLLSPGYRPVQVTQDLKSFWKNTYQEMRKELRVRYPKHSWPEDPWTAEAVRGVKKKNS